MSPGSKSISLLSLNHGKPLPEAPPGSLLPGASRGISPWEKLWSGGQASNNVLLPYSGPEKGFAPCFARQTQFFRTHFFLR